jgi:hypothetical protein
MGAVLNSYILVDGLVQRNFASMYDMICSSNVQTTVSILG